MADGLRRLEREAERTRNQCASSAPSNYPALKRQLERATTRASRGVEGHAGELEQQARVYRGLAHAHLDSDGGAAAVTQVCETGFMAGHSALIWLTAYPNANVAMFDLFEHHATVYGEQCLRAVPALDRRLAVLKGASRDTLPLAAESGLRCDVFSVDGGHSYDDALFDLLASRQLTHRRSVVLIDDTNCAAAWCDETNRAFEEYRARFAVNVLANYSWAGGQRGLTVFRNAHWYGSRSRSRGASWRLQRRPAT